MKILHVENMAGIPRILAEAQSSLGHEAHVLETWKFPADYAHDFEAYYTGKFFADLGLMKKVVSIARKHDVVHVHGGMPRKRLDLLTAALARPTAVHYHGSDARMGYGLHYRWAAKKKVVSRPDLLKFVPDSEYVPNPVRPQTVTFDMARTPTVIHMANDRVTKGTELIIASAEELKNEGVKFDFILMEKRPYEEASAALSKAHILIDQVIDEAKLGIAGVIGMTTLEAMAMGKAAVCSVNKDILTRFYSGIPVVPVAPDKESLKATLRQMIGNMDDTRRIGEAGAEYVRSNHDPVTIAKRFVAMYESII